MSALEREDISALDEKPPEASESPEPTFIPHRIFFNHVDSFHAKHIASVSIY